MGDRPVLFISYSWTSQAHQTWVIKLATELRERGVDARLDVWDLQPGHDTHAFMESIVTDPEITKVIMVCDEVYTKKANSRAAGVGSEAQIISPELYSKAKQEKFVAVVREKDVNGKPFLPAFCASRMYFDLSDDATYSERFDELVKWLYGIPMYERPGLGPVPDFTAPVSQPPRLKLKLRQALDSIRAGHASRLAHVSAFLQDLSAECEVFRIASNRSTDFDDKVIASIDAFIPLRNDAIELFSTAAQYDSTDVLLEPLHHFMEDLAPLMFRPSNIHTYAEWDFDNFKFVVHEIFLYLLGAYIKQSRFDHAAYFFENEYYFSSENMAERMYTFPIFRRYTSSLAERNRRLGLRRASLRADLLKSRNSGLGLEFKHIMTADFIAFLRARWVGEDWYPETLLYSQRSSAPLEIFARSKSKRYFERITKLIGISTVDEFKHYIDMLEADRQNLPDWGYFKMEPSSLAGKALLCTVD